MLMPPLILREAAAARCADHVRRAEHHRRHRWARPLRPRRKLPLRYRSRTRLQGPAWLLH